MANYASGTVRLVLDRSDRQLLSDWAATRRRTARSRVLGCRSAHFLGTAIFAVFVCCVLGVGSVATAQLIEDGPYTILPPNDLPAPVPLLEIDAGDLTSRGNGAGAYVRPTNPFDLDRPAYYYPPFTDSPLSPAQESLRLVANEPLTLIVPWGGSNGGPFNTILESLSVNGFNIHADFHRRVSSLVTATIYGPQDRIYLLGPLSAGDYHLMFSTLVTDDWPGPNVVISPDGTVNVYESARYTGVIDFTVHPVPEPSSLVLLALGVIACGAFCRMTRAAPRQCRNRAKV
jgi:hypothetical protein